MLQFLNFWIILAKSPEFWQILTELWSEKFEWFGPSRLSNLNQLRSGDCDLDLCLLKTDLEGADLRALRGAEELFRARRARVVVSEVTKDTIE